MQHVLSVISYADGAQIDRILRAVLARYQVLYSQWEISLLSIEKSKDRNEQLDQIIMLLQNLKT